MGKSNDTYLLKCNPITSKHTGLVYTTTIIHLSVGEEWYIQWNLDLTKRQGTGEIDSLYRGFVISRFFSIHYTITGLKNIVRYIEGFAI